MISLLYAFAVMISPTQIATPAYRYSFGDGAYWENRLTHRRIDLGPALPVEIEVGDRPENARHVELRSTALTQPTSNGYSISDENFTSSDHSLSVEVFLTPDPNRAILHKYAKISNIGDKPVRILNVVLGRFPVGAAKTEGGDRGFPLYLDQSFFVSITHPAGFSHVEGKDVVLRQYPGKWLKPHETFQSMEAIYGVSKRGQAHQTFTDYVRSRMCRVIYGHDKPYAILESFGGEENTSFRYDFTGGVSESFLHRNLDDVAAARAENGAQFDFYNVDFWQDRAGDLTTFNRTHFPNGFAAIRDQIESLGMKPALWIDSGGLPYWSIDENPATKACHVNADGTGPFCRASEPIAQMYTDAFLKQMRDNHVGLIKFDNLGPATLGPVCNNPNHDHLPGPLYSTEAIYDSVIDCFATLRRANPNVFIMLYWGYRSPWWLQWGDTYFESGSLIEGASPAQYPTPYARDAVTQRLDQAQLTIQDTPWIGKDSLGVWLSDWSWNSGIGKARWQEGTVMDMARGSLLFQLWTDEHFLTPPERDQVATFINLMKANPSCFEHTHFILGNPNRAEPYGYSCCDGHKAFLSIDNACLRDSVVTLNLGDRLGLPRNRKWDVYRWYPTRARIAVATDNLSMVMRPYGANLLEVVPAGEQPSLQTDFKDEAPSLQFEEPTRSLGVQTVVDNGKPAPADHWETLKITKAASENGATLKVLPDGSVLAGGPTPDTDTYLVTVTTRLTSIRGLMIEALPDKSLPSNGPGRVYNGNFALTDLKIQAAPLDNPSQVRDVKLSVKQNDFFQTSFGGWPPEAMLDNDPVKSGWSIFPRVGESHVVTLEPSETVVSPSGSQLTFTMRFGDRSHILGRFKLWASDRAGAGLPGAYSEVRPSYKLTIPVTRSGGLLFIVGGRQEDKPTVAIGSGTVPLQPVWSSDTNWSCPWTAWRLPVPPSDRARVVSIDFGQVERRAMPKLAAYYLPY